MFDLFDSPRTGMGLHMREGVRSMIFILNPNPTSLSFWESWLFNISIVYKGYEFEPH